MVRSTFLRVAAAAALVWVSGCERTPSPPAAEILETFDTATGPVERDEVVTALPPGGLVASPEITEAQLENGYLVDEYLIGGETVEVLWVHEPGAGLPTEAFRERLNPLIFRGGFLDGSGWEHFDRRGAEWGIPDRWVLPSALPAAVPTSEVRSF